MARRPRARTEAIDQSGAGTTVIAEAVPGTHIRVENYTVIMAGGGTYQFRTGSRDLSGAMPAEDKGGASPRGSYDSPVLIGDTGEDLSIVTTTGAARGHITIVRTPGG